jgi:hypothetical protein
MTRAFVLCATAVLLLAQPLCGAARADVESEAVKEGVAAYEGLEYGKAVTLLKQALTESLTREEKIATYRALGSAYVGLEQPGEARAAFVELLRLDPAHELNRSISPRIRAVFEEAREALATAQLPGEERAGLPELVATERVARARAGQPFTLRFAAPEGAASAVLFVRRQGAASYSRTRAAVVGHDIALTVPGLEVSQPGVDYYAVALDSAGVAVARAGSLDRPFTVEVAEVARRPVYKKGWFWGVLVGVAAAAGAAVGLGLWLGTSVNPSTPASVTLAPR